MGALGAFGFLVQLSILAALAAIALFLWRQRPAGEATDPLYPPADVTRLAPASLVLKGPAHNEEGVAHCLHAVIAACGLAMPFLGLPSVHA